MSLQNWYPSHRVPTVHVCPHKVVCESLYCLLAYRASFQEALYTFFVSAVGQGSDGQFALLWPEILDQGSKSQWHSSHTRRQSKVGKWLFDPWTTVWPARSLQQDISHQAVLTHMCLSKSLNIILAVRADFPWKLWSLHFACPLSSSAWLKSRSMSHCGLLIKNTVEHASWYTQRQVCADKNGSTGFSLWLQQSWEWWTRWWKEQTQKYLIQDGSWNPFWRQQLMIEENGSCLWRQRNYLPWKRWSSSSYQQPHTPF